MGALGADFEQTITSVGDPAAVRGVFFQPYQFKAKLGQGPLKKLHDIFVKYLTKSELPKQGEPTNFYYFGVPAAIVTVEAFRRAGPHPTRASWEAAIQSMKNFDTGVLADTETFSKSYHVGVQRMYAIGLDKDGNEVIYTAWDKPLGSNGE